MFSPGYRSGNELHGFKSGENPERTRRAWGMPGFSLLAYDPLCFLQMQDISEYPYPGPDILQSTSIWPNQNERDLVLGPFLSAPTKKIFEPE